jgi:ketosteroid isomerase-like protein
VFDRGTAAFNAHDIDGFAELIADEAVFEAPGGMQGDGKTACAEFYGMWLTAFPDAHVDINGLHVVDDVAVEEGTFTGTQDGVLRGQSADLLPTGRPVTVDYIQVLTVREGKVVSFNLMFDRLLLLEQLGVAPALQPAG